MAPFCLIATNRSFNFLKLEIHSYWRWVEDIGTHVAFSPFTNLNAEAYKQEVVCLSRVPEVREVGREMKVEGL